MVTNIDVEVYRRQITNLERYFSLSPYSLVAIIARIRGTVSQDMLKTAVSKVQQRHQNLRIRIEMDDNHVPWFTSENVQDIPIKIELRESETHWQAVLKKECKIPFEFDSRPAIRFILVQSPSESDLIILCHHIICDGMSRFCPLRFRWI